MKVWGLAIKVTLIIVSLDSYICCSLTSQIKLSSNEYIVGKFSLIYRREDWKHWSDFNNDCMNTRHETLVLQADALLSCHLMSVTYHLVCGMTHLAVKYLRELAI